MSLRKYLLIVISIEIYVLGALKESTGGKSLVGITIGETVTGGWTLTIMRDYRIDLTGST